MVSIVADNRDVERCLEKILAEARRGGAEFAPSLVLRCVNGSLSVELPPESSDQLLIKLPQETLVPTALFGLTLQEDDIVIDNIDPAVTSECRTLCESILELYNLTGKIGWFRRTSPLLFLRAHPELAQRAARGQDEPLRRILTTPLPDGGENRLLLRRFLASRWFGFADDSGTAPTRVLMPILDLMNHHEHGSPFENAGIEGGRFLRIQRAKKMPREERECFVRYGPYDAMEMLLAYNFVDESASFMRSIPMEVTLPEVGMLAIRALKKKGGKRNVPTAFRDIAPYLPRIVSKQPNYLEIASLIIPTRVTPQAFRRVLNLLIATLNPGYADRLDLIVQAEEKIVDANKAHYEALKTGLHDASTDTAGDAEILRGLTRAYDVQLDHLRHYNEMARRLAA